MEHLLRVYQNDIVSIQADGAFRLEITARSLQPALWVPPVHPPMSWYCAVWHDPTGGLNQGYKHTGIDLNLDKRPWGDVERGYPVHAMADGRISQIGKSDGWLGVVVIEYAHAGAPIWFRYAHLDVSPWMAVGDTVAPGMVLGTIANWVKNDGGDHLHLDCSLDAFGWNEWLSKRKWIDPVPVLEAHLGATIVDGMLKRV